MSRVELARTAAAGAALVLALSSRGDVLVLAAALGVVAARPLPAVALGVALVATGWRWGSTGLEDIAGAQAVLGPAGWVAPARAAVAAWLAAGVVVLTTPAWSEGSSPAPGWRRWLVVAASGASAAVVVAGPAPGGDLWVRPLAVVVALGLAVGVAQARGRWGTVRRVVDGLVVVVAGVALALVAAEAGAWSGTLSVAAATEGLVVAVAAAALATCVVLTRGRDGAQPPLSPRLSGRPRPPCHPSRCPTAVPLPSAPPTVAPRPAEPRVAPSRESSGRRPRAGPAEPSLGATEASSGAGVGGCSSRV